MDKLDAIVEIQKRFAERFIDFKGMTARNADQWLDKMATCITEEASELRRETNWKHVDYFGWSKKRKKLDKEAIKKEIMDILAFTLEAALIAGMDSNDIFDAFVKKVEENHERQKRNY